MSGFVKLEKKTHFAKRILVRLLRTSGRPVNEVFTGTLKPSRVAVCTGGGGLAAGALQSAILLKIPSDVIRRDFSSRTGKILRNELII